MRVLRAMMELERRLNRALGWEEIAEKLGFRVKAVQDHMVHLEAGGFAKREAKKQKFLAVAMTPTRESWDRAAEHRKYVIGRVRPGVEATVSDHRPLTEPLAVIGEVHAGPPGEADTYSDVVVLPSLETKPGEFRIWIRGDSMYGPPHYLADGDVAVCRREDPAVGDIVIVRIESQVTIKVLAETNGAIKLKPLNRKHRTITLSPSDEGDRWEFQGRVVYLIRRFER